MHTGMNFETVGKIVRLVPSAKPSRLFLDDRPLGHGLPDSTGSSKTMFVGYVVPGGSSDLKFPARVILELFVVLSPMTLLLLLLWRFFLFLRCPVGILSSRARVVRILGSISTRIRGISTRSDVSPGFTADRDAPTADFDCGGMLRDSFKHSG